MDAIDHAMERPRYRDWAPTAFDPRGAFASGGMSEDGRDRGAWIVGPCSRTRDSEVLELSNWDAQLEALGGEGDHVEVHRFGHWGPGWIEIAIVSPEAPDAVLEALGGLVCSLADYPVLDEQDHSRREYEAAIEQIEDQAGRWIREGAPEDWPAQLYRQLPDRAIDAIQQPGGGGPTDAEYKTAIKALKLMEPKRLRVRTLSLRKVTRAGQAAPMYRDIRVSRWNPAYPD